MAEPIAPGVGDIRGGPLRLKGWKVASLALRENELRASLRAGKAGGRFDLVLKGIIAFKDEGVIGRPLAGASVEDLGSFRVLRFLRPNGKVLLRCEYLEGEIRAGTQAPPLKK